MTEKINHPLHYGGDTLYEAIKVIEAWGLGFCLGNTLKYISRAGKKTAPAIEDLRKAAWYLNREIERLDRVDKNSNLTWAQSMFVAHQMRCIKSSDGIHDRAYHVLKISELAELRKKFNISEGFWIVHCPDCELTAWGKE